jgi:hypothetical protein
VNVKGKAGSLSSCPGLGQGPPSHDGEVQRK